MGREKGDNMNEERERLVYMWGYLPGALPERLPLLSPTPVKISPEFAGEDGSTWQDVCGGGCGFATAISGNGKLITWGSTDDLGQSYVTSGRHGETPKPFPLPTNDRIVKSAAGWAHCIAVTEKGEVYTWGWKECVPTGKVFGDVGKQGTDSLLTEQVNSRSGGVEEGAKRRRISPAKQAAENSSSSEESLSALPCLVTLNPGIRISTVAAGGRHTLVLSDTGQVWGWGYGGEGQLGLSSRVRIVSTPHLVPCIDTSSLGKDITASLSSLGSEGQYSKVPGSYIKGIACGGRHSAVITDAGALLTFGWGLYGQCGQGSTDDELSPSCVSSLLGINIEGVAAGLWHTVCVSTDGDVYTFGGNQFGQLGTGSDQAETLPRLLDTPNLENVHAKIVSCGARHSAIVADDGKVFCWGWNKYGQLGLGDVIDRNIPAQVPIDGCAPKNVACGWWHTLLLAESPT